MFVSSLDLTGEVLVDTLTGKDEFIIRVPIGFDQEEGLVFSLLVALSPLTGYADVPGYELVFNIVEAATDETSVIFHSDGLETRRFLPEPALRAKVRTLILIATEMLIDVARPNLVSMTTHTAHLPNAALAKFHEICAVFRANGFTAGKGDSWHGRHIWMMERQA